MTPHNQCGTGRETLSPSGHAKVAGVIAALAKRHGVHVTELRTYLGLSHATGYGGRLMSRATFMRIKPKLAMLATAKPGTLDLVKK